MVDHNRHKGEDLIQIVWSVAVIVVSLCRSHDSCDFATIFGNIAREVA